LTIAAYTLTTRKPAVCAVCRRRATWLGYTPVDKWLTPQGPAIWLCDDPQCHGAGKVIYKMPRPKLDAIEQSAALEAGSEAAQFLETCGTTDLAKLTEEQWHEFCRRFVRTFEKSMRRAILDEKTL
jgi:hypothetical protein